MTIILALIFIVIKLNIQFYKEEKGFKKKLKILANDITQISKNNSENLNKIKLSEELKNKLKIINTTLGTEIFELNRELFEIVSRNNLA